MNMFTKTSRKKAKIYVSLSKEFAYQIDKWNNMNNKFQFNSIEELVNEVVEKEFISDEIDIMKASFHRVKINDVWIKRLLTRAVKILKSKNKILIHIPDSIEEKIAYA